MDSRLILRHPTGRVRPGGRRPERDRGGSRPRRPQGRDGTSIRKSLDGPATKSPRRTTRRPVPQSDTGGPGEHPQAFGRTLVKELGKMTPYPRYKGCSRRKPGAAANRLRRLFTKNTGRCQRASGRIASDACSVSVGQGRGSAQATPPTEAPINGGRNYDGPKVAKFLVG
jgi:hypothetical protein